MSALRRTYMPRALSRPSLVLGGERELVLMSGLLTVGIAFVCVNWVAAAYAGVAFPIALYWLRKLAKTDPAMSKVYLRHLKYQNYYPARTTAWREQ